MSARRRNGAIVGYGFIAEKGHVPAYATRDDLAIVAVADVCEARRRAARVALPNARIYEDYASLLAAEGASLDFVDIATPPYVHAEIARAALQRGLHVLCEKPLATTAADARAMVADARKNRRVLYPSHNYKHAPVIKAVRRILDAGEIGDVHAVTLSTFRSTHARGVPEWNESWRRDLKYSGGGIAMDHGSHTLYLAFDWLRSYPTSVSATMTTTAAAATTQTAPADTEDTFVATLAFPTGIATAHLTWTAGIRKVIYTLHGSRGAIRVEDDELEVSIMRDPRGGVVVPTHWDVRRESVSSAWMDASHVHWFASLFGDFASAIDRGDFVGKDALDAVCAIETINAAYASARAKSREQPLGPEA